MAVRRTGIQIVSLGAVAAVLAIGLAAIALGDRADATPATTSATADVRLNPTDEKYDQLRYRAAAGQRNDVAITLEKSVGGTAFRFTIDDIVAIRAEQNCSHPDEADLTRVECTVEGYGPNQADSDGPSLAVQLDDQNDRVIFANPADARFAKEFALGAGADTFSTKDTGGYDGSSVWGGPGNDKISVGTGSTVQAGHGSDTVVVVGNNSYGSGDAGDDTITGGDGAQFLVGASGDDLIRGGSANDEILGGSGNDALYGDRGDDTMTGGRDDDKLFGGSGNDRLSGGPGRDEEKS